MQRHTPLGYRIVDGKADIVPEAAQIVKAVFQAYLGGTSTYQIAKDLTKQGVLNASHKPSWNHGSVGKILENKKYTGDEFYPPLIESEIFKQVQNRRQETVKSLGRHVQPNSFRNQTQFSGKLYCGICGQPYRRYVEHCNQPSENVKWKCKHYIKSNRVSCQNIFLIDEQIENAFMNVINQIIATPAMLEQRRPIKTPAPCPVGETLTRQIKETLNAGQYKVNEIKELAYTRAAAQYRVSVIDDSTYRKDQIKAAFLGKEKQMDFDERLFQQVIRKITVNPDGRLQFELLNGLLFDKNIEEN
ncbi:recombinase family protein [Clostridium sp. HBUAS56010]|uniref:recombinase family protein n=1 Tax=Clostridium sp. HBUAS56010 TaxID=2571127 RepID=UPI001178A360|nr:recombinase family protein [Clostridium sp. HBUAS56010]